MGSLESIEVSPELIELMKTEKRLCKQLHLPLQSGTNEVLKAMGRPYKIEKFYELLAEIRSQMPDVAVTTDIIVGFPGETGEQFEQTFTAARQMEFSGIHVFPYSPRRGTPAADFPNQVSEDVKKERAHRLQELSDESALNYRKKFIGKELEVVWEAPDATGQAIGWSSEYLRVYGKGGVEERRSIGKVKVSEIFRDGVLSESVFE